MKPGTSDFFFLSELSEKQSEVLQGNRTRLKEHNRAVGLM